MLPHNFTHQHAALGVGAYTWPYNGGSFPTFERLAVPFATLLARFP